MAKLWRHGVVWVKHQLQGVNERGPYCYKEGIQTRTVWVVVYAAAIKPNTIMTRSAIFCLRVCAHAL